jgi:hypothetical protein
MNGKVQERNHYNRLITFVAHKSFAFRKTALRTESATMALKTYFFAIMADSISVNG